MCLARDSNYAFQVTNSCDVRTCGRNCAIIANGDSVDFVRLCVRGVYRVLRDNSDESPSNDGKDGLRVAIRKHGLHLSTLIARWDVSLCWLLVSRNLVLPGYLRTLILGFRTERFLTPRLPQHRNLTKKHDGARLYPTNNHDKTRLQMAATDDDPLASWRDRGHPAQTRAS